MKAIFPELKKSWNDACPVIAIERNPWEEQYYCFDSGPDDGAGSGAPGDERPDTVTSGNQPKDTGLSFSTPKDDGGVDRRDSYQGKATTFGVDGRSITGSAEGDAKLGYTSAPGSGKPGPNYDALNAATAEQKAAAKNTAAQFDGKDLTSRTNARNAVANTLANYEPGDVTRSGNFTDQGAEKAQANIQAALDARAAMTYSPSVQGVADQVLGAPTFTGLPNQRGITPPTTGVGPRPTVNLSVVGKGPLNPALSNVPANILGRRAISPTPLEIGGVTVDNATAIAELQNRALAGDEQAKAELDAAVQAGINTAGMVGIPSVNAGITPTGVVGVAPGGIATAPQATAANVLAGIQENIAKAAENFTPGVSQPGQDPNFFSDLTQAAASTAAPGFRVDDIFTSPSMGRAPPADNPNTPQNETQDFIDRVARGEVSDVNPGFDLANLDALAARGFDDETAEMGQRGGLTQDQIDAGMGYTAAGLPRGLDFVNIQRPDGRTVRATTNLAGPTAKQAQEAPGYMSTIDPVTGKVKEGFIPGATNFVFGNPIQQAYGFEIPDYDPNNPDASTGEITGVIGPPSMKVPSLLGAGLSLIEDIFLDDPSTYGSSAELLTGMTPTVYTGYGPGSVPPPDSGSGGPDVVKAPNDPCPPGFQLINGTCTPVGDTGQGQEEEAGSSFQINPTTGLPTLFTPFTQATPVGQMNPFVLQPYTPNQAQYIQQQRSGIQALSPTGAALGRQI